MALVWWWTVAFITLLILFRGRLNYHWFWNWLKGRGDYDGFRCCLRIWLGSRFGFFLRWTILFSRISCFNSERRIAKSSSRWWLSGNRFRVGILGGGSNCNDAYLWSWSSCRNIRFGIGGLGCFSITVILKRRFDCDDCSVYTQQDEADNDELETKDSWFKHCSIYFL